MDLRQSLQAHSQDPVGTYPSISGTDLTKLQLWSEEPHSLSPETAQLTCTLVHLVQDLERSRVPKDQTPSIPHG